MIPYYIIWLGLIAAAIAEKRWYFTKSTKNAWNCALFSILVFLLGGALSRGDFSSYANIYLHYGESGQALFERGYGSLIYLLKWCTLNYKWLFFYSVMLSLFFKFCALLKEKICGIAEYFCLYFPLMIVYFELGSLRFMLGSSIVFFALTFLRSRKLHKYFFWIMIATTMHAAMATFIFLPFFIKLKKKRLIVLLSIATGYFILLFSSSNTILNIFNANYYTSKIINYIHHYGHIRFTMQLARLLFEYAAMEILYKNSLRRDGSSLYLYWEVYLYIFAIVGLLQLSQETVSRLLSILGVLEPIILLFLIRKIVKTERAIVIIILFVILGGALGRSLNLANGLKQPYLPYKNMFLGDIQTPLSMKMLRILNSKGIN